MHFICAIFYYCFLFPAGREGSLLVIREVKMYFSSQEIHLLGFLQEAAVAVSLFQAQLSKRNVKKKASALQTFKIQRIICNLIF